MPDSGADRLDERLALVFGAVFPDLPQGSVRAASIGTVAGWDSLQTVTLMALMEEEFGIAIPPVDLVELRSFGGARAYLARRLATEA